MSRRIVMEVNPAYECFRSVLESLVAEGLPDDAKVIYRGRNIVAAFTRQEMPLCVKAFGTPSLINRFIYGHLRPSKASRSYRNAIELTRRGFNTPTPIGYADIFEGGSLVKSYYLCEHLASARSVASLEIEGIVEPYVDKMASELVAMHRQGIFCNDYTPGNILVSSIDNPSELTLSYIDLNRITFGRTSRRVLRRMFNSPFYFDTNIEKLLSSYARQAGMPLSTVTHEAMQARKRYNTIKRIEHPIRYRNKPAR